MIVDKTVGFLTEAGNDPNSIPKDLPPLVAYREDFGIVSDVEVVADTNGAADAYAGLMEYHDPNSRADANKHLPDLANKLGHTLFTARGSDILLGQRFVFFEGPTSQMVWPAAEVGFWRVLRKVEGNPSIIGDAVTFEPMFRSTPSRQVLTPKDFIRTHS